MLNSLSFGYLTMKNSSTTAEIIGIYSTGTIVPIKYMPIISAVGLFCASINLKKTTKRETVQHFSECHS